MIVKSYYPMIKFYRKSRLNLPPKTTSRKYLTNTVGIVMLTIYFVILSNCVTNQVDNLLAAESLSAQDSEQIESRLKDLYQSFSYDTGAEPDWELMRSAFFEGAQFVGEAPTGAAPLSFTIDDFIISWHSASL